MSAALDLDISVLVGEMEAEPCDTPGHEMGLAVHDDGPATHYVSWHKPCGCMEHPQVVARCAAFTNSIIQNIAMKCGACGATGETGLAEDFYTILGPVGGSS